MQNCFWGILNMISPPRLDLKEIAFVQRVLSVLLWWSKALMIHDVKYSMKPERKKKNCNFQSLPDGASSTLENRCSRVRRRLTKWTAALQYVLPAFNTYFWPGKTHWWKKCRLRHRNGQCSKYAIHMLTYSNFGSGHHATLLDGWPSFFFFYYLCKISLLFVIWFISTCCFSW